LVDEEGRVVGTARRSEVHGNRRLMHPVVHCLVTDGSGRLLLQLRSRHKDVQPGKWDTSVGGHVDPGETIEQALRRELREELGLDPEGCAPEFLYRYVMRSDIETELVHTFRLTSEGPFRPDPNEIDDVRFWTPAEIEAELGGGVFTPNFEDEYARFGGPAHRYASGPSTAPSGSSLAS
jgi:isopentenyldiphosphate isomerase